MSCNFCPMPFVHMNIKQEGKISACWRYPDRIGDYMLDTLADVWNGEELRTLRKQLLNGEQPSGCRSCWDMEKNGVTSTRQQTTIDYERMITYDEVKSVIADDYSMPYDFVRSVEIRFDNICNLMCRHCSPDYSSKWEVAVKKDQALMNKMVEYETYRKKDYHVKLHDDMIDEVVACAPNLQEVLIAGGEPLYHDKHYAFIERLLPHANHIMLSYNSNLTTVEYKGKSILELWKNFRKVLLRVSIDGDPSCYDYVRVHNDLPKIEENIKKVHQLRNVSMNATCTTSLLNITRLVPTIKYFLSLGAYFHTSLVQYPNALNIQLLPQELKNKVNADWEDFKQNIDNNLKMFLNRKYPGDYERHKRQVLRYAQYVIDYMNNKDQSDQWNTFLDYISVQDKYHKTDLYTVYPEFLPYKP